MLKRILLPTLILLLGTLYASRIEKCARKCNPPAAKQIEYSQTVHDITLDDPYHWMIDKDRNNPETLQYIKAENDYARCVTRDLDSDIETLFVEMKNRIRETDMAMPVRIDSFYYYSRTVAGQQYSIYCRKKGTLLAPEEIILDVNELAKGHDFYEVAMLNYSPDHRYVAYDVDTTGFESYTLYIRNIMTGELLPDTIPYVNGIAWAADNKTLFYVQDLEDDRESPSVVYRHVLGTDLSEDVLIYREEDCAFGIWLTLSKNHQWLIMGTSSNDTSEIRFMPADTPEGEFTLIRPREEGIEYYVEPSDSLFYIMTNLGDPDYRLVTASFDDPDDWHPYYVPEEGVTLNTFDVFRDFVVFQEQINALEHLKILDLRTGEFRHVDFPQEVYTFWGNWNPEYDTHRYRLTYSSLTMPSTLYEYDIDQDKLIFLKRYDTPEGFRADDYITKRIFAPAADSVMIPISLLYRAENENQRMPMYLTAYGSYGSNSDPYFSSNVFSLVDRGFIFAIAHIRGGSEWGEWWHEQGRLQNKKNTFSDFITSAEYLIDQGFTSPEMLAIEGGSAGGLLMGVVANWRPDLFKVVIADVPAVNEIDIMLDPTIPGVMYHYSEWGNPNIPEHFSYMLSWDPYYNLKEQSYPHILATAGIEDNRVPYWEPARWVAKLRGMKTDDNVLIFKTEMSGHSGASGRYDFLREIAYIYAVVLDLLEVPVVGR